MASLASKNGVFLTRFRFRGKAYKKSLKTRSATEAKAALCIVELTLHRLTTGQLSVPPGVNPADFIVSGGTRTAPPQEEKAPALTFAQLIEAYLNNQKNRIAESYWQCQATHLRHLQRYFGRRAELPCSGVTANDLERFVQERLAIRQANTVCREKCTLQQFFGWAVDRKHLLSSPACGLKAVKAGMDLPPFRTITEIEKILGRGGLDERARKSLWDCLYLAPGEIAELLATVRENCKVDASFILHVIPAYTGMRRGEVLRARWVDVDFAGNFITAYSRKQSRRQKETSRMIDLHVELREHLQRWRDESPRGQFIITDPKALGPLAKDRANRWFWQPMRGTDWCLNGKKNWFKIGFHSYRHSFASNMAARSIDQRVIDEYMGHQTEEMRKRYRHLFPKDRRAAIECFSLKTNSNGHPAG